MAATDTASSPPPEGTPAPNDGPDRDDGLRATRRRHLLIGTAIGLAALLAAVGAALFTNGATEEDQAEPADLGEVLETPATSGLVSEDTTGAPVPTDRLDDLDGGDLSLTDYAGTPLVVNFFGSWCVPCRKEMPDLQQLHEAYGDRVSFVGVAVNDTADDARDFVEDMGVTYDVARDVDGEVFPDFGSVNMPTTALVSPEGRIVKVVAGAVTAERLQTLVREELGV